VWPPRVGDLTARQIALLQLADAVEADERQRQREEQSAGDSMSHEHYSARDSRREAFAEFQ